MRIISKFAFPYGPKIDTSSIFFLLGMREIESGKELS
jgi:hypothetical protein